MAPLAACFEAEKVRALEALPFAWEPAFSTRGFCWNWTTGGPKMVLADKNGDSARNGKGARGPSPNGHAQTESTSEDESSGKSASEKLVGAPCMAFATNYSVVFGCVAIVGCLHDSCQCPL